jgi:hypothetical protein
MLYPCFSSKALSVRQEKHMLQGGKIERKRNRLEQPLAEHTALYERCARTMNATKHSIISKLASFIFTSALLFSSSPTFSAPPASKPNPQPPPSSPASKSQASATPSPSRSQDDTTQEGWSMHQTSQLMGEFDVLESPKGVIATSSKKAISLLCIAPFKEVVLFSDRTKKYSTTTFEKFRCTVDNTSTVVNGGLVSDIPILKLPDKTFEKVNAHVFQSTRNFTQVQIEKNKRREIPNRAVMNLSCYSTEDFKQDPHVGVVLSRFYGMPKMPGIPIFAAIVDLGTDKSHFLTTTAIKKTRVKDSSFVLPSSYQKVARHEDIYISPDTADEIELMNLGH